MTTPDPLDERDLDLVAALAAGMLDGADSDRAKQLIAGDARFADEHAAQLLAIDALGGNDWYQPLNDFEKARLGNSVVPKAVSQKATWSIRILKPLSIAAVAVVIVGFAGMTLFGGGTDMDLASTDGLSDEAERSVAAATEAPTMEAPATDASVESLEDAAVATEEGALAPKFSFPTSPPEGQLEVLHVEESRSIEEFLEFQQWTEPVALDRYVNLECWPDAADYNNVLGVSLSNVLGIDYEIVRTTEAVEARTVEGCEATILQP
jgi:hypothetical protein